MGKQKWGISIVNNLRAASNSGDKKGKVKKNKIPQPSGLTFRID